MDNETVVHVAIVREVEGSVLKEIVVKLMPGVFDEGDGNVAKGRGELGANPSPPDLLVGVVARPENASVKCICHNGCNVRSVDGALCGVASVVPADVGVVERVASGFGVNGKSVGVVLALPLLNEGVDGVNQAMLWNSVEEANKVVVGGV